MASRVVAVDWSGKATREAEFIWTAVVDGGRLSALDNGRSREETIAHLIELASQGGDVVVGLDFAFSFPRWFCEERLEATEIRDVWRTVARSGEAWLRECEPPFWGRRDRARDLRGREPLRRTEVDAPGAKSVFQIGGAGAVGTGSLRGMPHLLELDGTLAIWPFDAPGSSTAVEIYPRLLTGKVNKGRHRERIAYLEDRFAEQDPAMLERAAGSDDAFDAATSALVMARHASELERLQRAQDPDYRIEGRIWAPSS